MTLILASSSVTRANMLRLAGVDFIQRPARTDESAIKASLQAEGASPEDIVDTLAEYKAKRVAQNEAGLILGCDQILVSARKILSKAETLDQARQQLKGLRATPHTLLSAAVIYDDHKPIWRKIGRAQLFMRAFSDEFLEHYLSENADTILQSVGCYQIEGAGVSLFDRIQGDYHAILGMPLLDIMAFLRQRGELRI